MEKKKRRTIQKEEREREKGGGGEESGRQGERTSVIDGIRTHLIERKLSKSHRITTETSRVNQG